MASVTAVCDSTPRRTAGGKERVTFLKCTKATYYCCVWQNCHLCHSFLLCQLPFLSVNGKPQSSIRKVVFWTLYSYLAYPLCLIKKGHCKTHTRARFWMPGWGCRSRQGTSWSAGALAAQHAPAWGQELCPSVTWDDRGDNIHSPHQQRLRP